MTPAHLLLALAVVFVWGTNFVIIKFGLGEMPPLLFATLRFLCSCLPWVFLVRRPAVPWRLLIGTGVCLGFGLFGLLFIAMGRDLISPGVASLVVQTQAFFTIALSMLLLGEKLRRFQATGLALCAGGLLVLFAHMDASLTLTGLLLTLTGALSWACSNLIAKKAGQVDMLAFMVWSSLFAVPPLLAASLLFEGPERIIHALGHASWIGWSAALWQGLANTLFGYGAWNWLLSRYPAATVSPLSLLVPVFGMATAALVFAEPLPPWKLEAAALLLLGLVVITLWPRLRLRLQRRDAA